MVNRQPCPAQCIGPIQTTSTKTLMRRMNGNDNDDDNGTGIDNDNNNETDINDSMTATIIMTVTTTMIQVEITALPCCAQLPDSSAGFPWHASLCTRQVSPCLVWHPTETLPAWSAEPWTRDSCCCCWRSCSMVALSKQLLVCALMKTCS